MIPKTIEINPEELGNKQVVANLGNNLDQATTTTPDASNQRRTRRRPSATNGVEE